MPGGFLGRTLSKNSAQCAHSARIHPLCLCLESSEDRENLPNPSFPRNPSLASLPLLSSVCSIFCLPPTHPRTCTISCRSNYSAPAHRGRALPPIRWLFALYCVCVLMAGRSHRTNQTMLQVNWARATLTVSTLSTNSHPTSAQVTETGAPFPAITTRHGAWQGQRCSTSLVLIGDTARHLRNKNKPRIAIEVLFPRKSREEVFWQSPAPMLGYNMPSQLIAANGSPS